MEALSRAIHASVTGGQQRPAVTGRARATVTAAVLGAALAAWVVAVQQMRGMDAGPGTDPGAFGWFIGIWLTMMAAMMLPATAPVVVMFSRLRGRADTAAFVAGYLLAWTVYGAGAYVVYRVGRESAPSFVAWDARGPWVAGGALVAAGIYQLTPLKAACLRHCRSPLHFLLGGRRGTAGALRAGVGHGGYCAGCCSGLMLALFALGVMSLAWMAVVAVVVLAEKALPRGFAVTRVLAVGLLAGGIWVAASPATVPGLTQPNETGTEMEMQP